MWCLCGGRGGSCPEPACFCQESCLKKKVIHKPQLHFHLEELRLSRSLSVMVAFKQLIGSGNVSVSRGCG